MEVESAEVLWAAPRVAALMAGALGRDGAWEADQVRRYTALAARYRL